MASSRLEDLAIHIDKKIANIKKCLLFRDIGKNDSWKPVIRKMHNEVICVHDLLHKMEKEVKEQEKLNYSLQEIRKTAERNQKTAQHLLELIPCHLPKIQSCNTMLAVKWKGETEEAFTKKEKKAAKEKKPIKEAALITKEESENVPVNTMPTEKCKGETEKAVELSTKKEKKAAKEKKPIKEAALITKEEFESIPVYLKGRIKHDEINAVVQDINKAVLAKYKILCQPLKSMTAPVRSLYHRFIEGETKDTRELFFVVEEDIKMFTQLKLDRRFYNILCILRHCRRVREIRSSGLIRYVIC
ncbi:spindle and kinetochore-associated protein 1 [Ammospiza caudacuta]|uniref:spindle and kinetochore-associated protein 1 n=1 Tax=Ammospiza caudacuta TaxID=2857398 RepID=UPI0027390852|nr:spindle and kinetochore-associated protein 1 [Ammospiza caudacuta]XP_058679942.1 spindle and kinetochore-associated protein 1 [Ammospiza caudacuta]